MEIITPQNTIHIPFVVHSGAAYINEDVGPTNESPCKLNSTPNAITTMPSMIKALIAICTTLVTKKELII